MAVRVLIAKPGLDGHDKGAKVVANALRDAGMEVVYSGLHKSVKDIVKAAIEEDVDVVGLSILSGAHIAICGSLFAEMKAQAIGDKIVVVGGVIPRNDWERLHQLGVKAIYVMGTTFEEIADSIRKLVGHQ